MSELTPLREVVDALADSVPSPDFGELERRAARRGRRRVIAVVAATAAVVAGLLLAVTGLDDDRRAPQPVGPIPGPGANGWVALVDGGDIHLVRPGADARRLEVAGPGAGDAVCPAWSPDGTTLLFGRFTGTWESASGDASFVIVPVSASGAAGTPTVIGLDGFDLPTFEPRPCGTWAPDGRWFAFAGVGEVGVVDTRTGEIRRVPDVSPSDLVWRPGTDELAIAGDVGSDPEGRTLSAPVSVYSVSTDEVRRLGSVEAAHLSWSPDGSTLAYTGGEDEHPSELWLVDADGGSARRLVTDLGDALHGIGPEWSPRGDRIVYQRVLQGRGEAHEVVLVDVADGTETVIAPPTVDPGRRWYPRSVAWSPDGAALLYAAWFELDGRVGDAGSGVIVVPVDAPDRATMLTEQDFGVASDNNWAPNQAWGRRPG